MRGAFISVLVAILTTPVQVVAQEIILWDFIKPIDFYKTCMTVTEDIGENSADQGVAKSQCKKHTSAAAAAVGASDKEHCKYFAQQISQATEGGEYHGGPDFCNKMLMFHSYKLKIDLLNYVDKEKLTTVCTESISTAINQGAGSSKTAAVQANIAVACKSTVETLFRANGMPTQMAQPTCKPFVEKANQAITAGELDPEDLGMQFCNGKAVAGPPFEKSEVSPMPLGFPLTESDWKPKVTLAHLKKMVRHAYKTPAEAMDRFDADKDGHLDEEEWKKMCKDLAIPRLDCKMLFKQIDADKNEKVDDKEWLDAMGVTLPELAKMSNDKHRNAAAAWPIADSNGDGNLTPEEFEAFCKDFKVSPEQAKTLFPKIDADGNGGINQDEFMNAFGVDLPELKRRARKKHGPPNDSFKAMDTNGDGKLQPQEFEEGCKALDIPPEQAAKLLPEIDTDGSGDIDLEEWGDAMGMDKDDLRHAIFDKLGKPEDALKKMDKDGDGVVSPEEMKEGLKAAGLTPEEAEAMMKEMDKDGDGKLSPEEFLKGAGADVMDEHRGMPAKGPTGGVTVPEFKERAKKKHGTPKAAFDAFDKSPKDGKISPEEFKEGCKNLEPPISAKDAVPLFAELDKNGDKGIDPEEFYEATGGCATCGDKFGIPVPEFVERLKAKHGTPKDAFDAFDKDPKDGKLSPEEFNALCADLKPPISPEEAGPLFKKLDSAPTNGEISPEEFFGAVGGPEKYGITVPEFKARAKRKHGTPKEAFDAFDKDNDGQISPEEFEEGCKNLDPPVSPEEARPLFNAMDKDSSDGVSPEEFYKTVGGPEEFAESAEEAAAAAKKAKEGAGPLDENGDGVVSPEEVQRAIAAGKVPPEQLKAMDKDGDGVISPEEAKQAAELETAKNSPKEKMKKALKAKFKNPKDAFDAMDTDGSGKLSPEEFKKGMEPEVSPEEAEKMMKEMDTDGDGVISEEEFYAANGPPEGFAPSPGEPGYAAPREAEESPVSLEEMKKRLLQAHGNGKKAWEALAGPGKEEMTCAQWEAKAGNYGIAPGQAKKLCKQMDANKDGIIGEDEFQNVMGVSPDEVKDRFLDEFGNAEEALKGTDLDGDGQVSEEELKKAMQDKLGLTPENAEKAAKEMMKKLDPDGDGKISGEDFKDATKAKADDLADRISDKLGSADEAMKEWDKDGDGKLTEEEFLKGAKDMGISEEAAKDMWKEKAGADGTMDTAEFAKGFGIGPDEIMEKCFAEYGNPDVAFDEMDKDKDGLLSPEEWAHGGKKMGLKPEQITRIFGEMDKNPNEHTHHHISKREFFDYLDFDLPNFKSWGDGYGDIDSWGWAHKKFNKLPHKVQSADSAQEATNFVRTPNTENSTHSKFFSWPQNLDSDMSPSETTVKDLVLKKKRDRAIPSKTVSSKSILHHPAMQRLMDDVSTRSANIQPFSSIHASEPQTQHRALVTTKPIVAGTTTAANHTAPSPQQKPEGRKEKMKAFSDMDTNGDGVIEPEEFNAAMSSAIPQQMNVKRQRLRGA